MWTVDEAWRDDVRALMKRKGISQADIARAAGVKPSAITNLFKPETKQSRIVPAVHRVLGLPPPNTTAVSERDEVRQRLDKIWRELTPAQRELLLELGASMKRSR
jgi:transcriptional regulator with XRE-family HTH domain